VGQRAKSDGLSTYYPNIHVSDHKQVIMALIGPIQSIMLETNESGDINPAYLQFHFSNAGRIADLRKQVVDLQTTEKYQTFSKVHATCSKYAIDRKPLVSNGEVNSNLRQNDLKL